MRSSLHLNDDTNQFGPGSDLMISLAAVLLMLTVITSHLYGRERSRAQEERAKHEHLRVLHARERRDLKELRARLARDSAAAGAFRVALTSVPAADFHHNPVTELVNPGETGTRIRRIVEEYRRQDYPYIFVIGHSSTTDGADVRDRSPHARLQRNWDYGGRRSALIAAMIYALLEEPERERLVVMTTGELDIRHPADPRSEENAWVEVVFGKEWKLPSRHAQR